VRSFHETGELGCRNQGDVARPSSSYDYSVLLINHLIEHGGQVLTETAVRRFTKHGFLISIVQDSCTPRLHAASQELGVKFREVSGSFGSFGDRKFRGPGSFGDRLLNPEIDESFGRRGRLIPF
jgi:hypothetical protein